MNYVVYTAKRYGNSSYLLRLEPEEGEYGVRVYSPEQDNDKIVIFQCFGLH